MRELGLRLQLNSALTAWNEAELRDTVALAAKLGIPLQVDPEVTPKDDGDTEPLSIRPSREAVALLLSLQAEARRKSAESEAQTGDGTETLRVTREGDDLLPPEPPPADEPSNPDESSNPGEIVQIGAPRKKHCGAGASSVAVDPYGEIYPCVQWRRSVGNLHERSIREIWTDRNRALQGVRRQNEAARETVTGLGREGALLSFCPGMAEVATGDPTRIYPSAEEKLELHKELENTWPSSSGGA